MQQDRARDLTPVWFSLGHLANDWAPAAIWLIAPAIALSMDLTAAQVGLLVTIHSFGAAVAYLPAGILTDRVSNHGRLLLATFWWVAVGYLLASLATDFWAIALLLALAGMGDAAWHPIATGVLVQRAPATRARMLGVHAVGGALAEVLAPLCVGALLAFFDWRTTLQISLLPAVIMGLVFWPLVGRGLKRSARPPVAVDYGALFRIWRRPQGLALIAMMIAYNMAVYALLSMTPLFLQRDQGLSSAQTGVAFAGMLLIGALAQPLVGHISDVSGRKPVVLTGLALAVLGLLAVAFGSSLWLIIGGLVVAAAVFTGIRSSILASAVDHSGRGEATTLGFAFMMLDGVGALGAVLAGAVGNLELRYAFLLAAGLAAAAFATSVWLSFPGHRSVPAHAGEAGS